MIVLDTTVLVYAVGDAHEYREPCRRLIAAIESGVVDATTTHQAVQEFAHVRARRRSRADAVELATAYIDLLSPLLTVDEADLAGGLQLFGGHERLGAFDAVLCASALAADAAVISADRAFAGIPGLRHVVPDADGVGSLLDSDARSTGAESRRAVPRPRSHRRR
ncbi:PIN domain-containing protein [Pseudonocardia sp. MH-G8]|uniref:type II toxin-antitoxin system VapC family toxin n=1 Tax=Pseudonocardia sp. MH-G8 TaxID=1854588 RepID=UPI000BA0F85C|nr:PIN domain-containing protein [Pseudonocardia sp. MH-G8]OZM79045.1 VapC toxin family PIN domain ribonuclease [Pseudonocardia sp. MH-G8]